MLKGRGRWRAEKVPPSPHFDINDINAINTSKASRGLKAEGREALGNLKKYPPPPPF